MVAKSTALTLTTLSLIPLLLTTPTSARLPGSLSGRHAHDAPHKKAVDSVSSPNANLFTGQFEKLKRAGKGMLNKSAGADSKKRRVKKRKNSCQPQAGFTASATATASTSVIGNQNWVGSGTTSVSSAATASATAAASAGSYNSPWNLEQTWAGANFFSNFNFWSWADPTHGTVQYVDSTTAWNEGLISINSAGNAVTKVDTTQHISGNRKAIRIHGNLVFTGALVILDAVHMPVGCGTWPAWWQNGPNWPYGGEIDILEGVNADTRNQVSLHTGSGCYMTGAMNQLGTLTTGNFDNRNCASYETSNQGCGVVDTVNSNSYGAGFNSAGGGVYVMKWDRTGIMVWFFSRGNIPADITADQPMPSTWGTPVASFPSTTCDPYKYFYDNFNIINTSLCGDWAGGVWSSSCAAATGYADCSDYVRNNGDKFAEAYWEIKSIKYFNSTTEL